MNNLFGDNAHNISISFEKIESDVCALANISGDTTRESFVGIASNEKDAFKNVILRVIENINKFI